MAVAGNVIEKGRSVQCLSNLRQFGVAMHMYADENGGFLPWSSHHREADGTSLSWSETLKIYLGDDFIGRCPSVTDHPANITYAINDFLTNPENGAGIPMTACADPALTLPGEATTPSRSAARLHSRGAPRGRVSPAMFRSSVRIECHRSGANYPVVDAHGDRLAWTE